MGQKLHGIDKYAKQRLKMCMIHKHPTVRKTFGKTVKWNVEYFVKIGLILANWYYSNNIYGYAIETYVEKQQSDNKIRRKAIEKMINKGVNIYNKQKLVKISYVFSK